MAIRRRGRRTIVVRGEVYYWHLVSGIGISPVDWRTKPYPFECKSIGRLRIESAEFRHRHLIINYHDTYIMDLLGRYGGLIIKPRIVRQWIEAALDAGWNPATAQDHFVLDNAENLIEA